MFDARSLTNEERLARIKAELAEQCLSIAASDQERAAVHKRTLQLCEEFRRALATGPASRPGGGATGPRSVSRQRGLPAARLRRVMDYIDASLAEPLPVPILAGVAGMSPSHFAALFKCSTGISPHEAVLRRRIARAKELLGDERRTIAAIGCQLGFSSQAHFTTVFRRRVGVAPSTFRRGRTGAGHRPHSQNSANPAMRPAECESPFRRKGH
jgi:AraC-like DNA-binding protein